MFVGAAVGLLASLVFPMGQRSWSHKRDINQSIRHFQHDTALDRERHAEKLTRAADQHKIAHTTSLEHYSEAMSVALDLARRETVRDVWVQRSLLNQTIMLNGALMLSCIFENFSQAALPRTDTPMSLWLLYALHGFLGIAILLCTVCILLCLKIQDRLGWYALGDPTVVYHCGKTHHTFNDYFDCHCESIRSTADASFYLGGAATILASVVLQCIKFISNYNFTYRSLVGLFVSFSCIGIVALPLLIRKYSVERWRPTAGSADFGGLGGATEEEERQLQLQREPY